jgi:S1-C subfamily serine protease
VPGSPAATAGLEVGDRLLVLDATWTDTVQDCYRAAAGVTPGESVKANVKRGDKEMSVTLKPVAGL